MGLVLVEGPTVEPVTVSEAKAHMRLDASDEDTLIGTLISAARQKVEQMQRRALVTQTWAWVLDEFPGCSWVALWVPLPPLQAVNEIEYVDPGGATQTWSAAKYEVLKQDLRGRILPAYGEVWPETRYQGEAVTIEFEAGYGDAGSDVPEITRLAILNLVAQWYEHREGTTPGAPEQEVPMGLRWMIEAEAVVEIV